MRGTIDRAGTMTAKRLRGPLMSSCALAAALIFAGQARQASAQAFNAVNPTPTQTGATVSTTSSTSTTVDVTAAQAVINWEPNGTALAANDGTGTIDFMPANRSITFESGYGYTGNYTVLNKIDAISPLTRPIGLDGAITSTVNGERGGAVWFYSPGGIIAGANSIFNVGSLVLTANDIDTTGGLFSPGGSIRFRAGAGSTAAVTIANTAQINLTNANSYLAVVAPVVIQRGAVDINGSAAYVSAERVDINVGSNLFNISVLSGFGSNGDPAILAADGKRVTIDHSGSTTSTVAAIGSTDDRRTYFVAVPKNVAVTMLVSGTLGYPAATTAGVENGQVILAAGQSVFGSSFGSITATDASLRITGGTITSRVNAFALNQAAIDSSTGNQTIIGQVDLTANNAEIHTATGRTVTITGDTTVRGAATDPSTAGRALATVDAGGALTINGNLTLDANGNGFVESGYGSIPATTGTGGTAQLAVSGAGAAATVTNNLGVTANGIGGGASALAAGDGRGGTASVVAQSGGVIAVAGSAMVSSSGRGGNSTNGAAGSGVGGSASVTSNGGTVNLDGNVDVTAVGLGGTSSNSTPGVGTGGDVLLTAAGGLIRSLSSISANATGPNGGGGSVGGTIGVVANAGAIVSPVVLLGVKGGANGTVSVDATGAGGLDASTAFAVYADSATLTHVAPTRATVIAGTISAQTVGSFTASPTTALMAGDTVDIVAGTTLSAGDITAVDGDVDLAALDGIAAGTVTAGDTVSMTAINGTIAVTSAIAGTNTASTDPDFEGSVGIGASGNLTVGNATALNSVALLSQTGTVTATTISAGSAGVVLAGSDVTVGTATVGDLFYVGAPAETQTLFGESYVLGQDDDPEVDLDALIAAGVTRAGGDVNITGSVDAGRLLIGSVGTTTLAGSNVSGTADFDALGALRGTALRIGGAINAAGDSISLIGPAAFDIASADVRGATGDLTLLAGTTLDTGDLAAGGSIVLGGGAGIATGDLAANGDITASSAKGPVTLGDVASASGSIGVLGGGNVELGSLIAAGTADVNSAGTATFLGNITADTIAIASSDIVLGTSPTTLIGGGNTTSITLENNGTRRSQVGGGDATGIWSLSNAEFGRLSAHTITINAPDAQDEVADLTIGQLDVIGSAGADTATRRRNLTGSELIFNSADELLVDGALSLTGAGANDSVSLFGNSGVGVDTATGSVNLTGQNGALAGKLTFGGDHIYVGSRAAVEQLVNLKTIESRTMLLGMNSGVVNPAGFIRAGGLVFNPGTGVYIQNTGPLGSDPNARAGFTAGSGGVTIRTDLGARAPEVVINGRQQRPDGTFLTGNALIPAITFAGDGRPGLPHVAQGSTVNSCLIFASSCGFGANDVPPLQDVVNSVFDPSAFLITLLETPLIELADFIPFSLEPLIDDPVTGAGNEDLWLGGGEKRDKDEDEDGNKS